MCWWLGPEPHSDGPEASTPRTEGKLSVKVVPDDDESTEMSPPLRVTMVWTVWRPRPVPCPGSLVVKNGSKIR